MAVPGVKMESRMNRSFCLLALLLLPLLIRGEELPEPDVVLTGTLTRQNHERYLALHFDVPPGVRRLTVSFEYDRAHRTAVDLGLEDPQRFRGWSGGNKASFFLSETAATPSYLPGPLPAGQWRLVLGVPNIRDGTAADYRAEISFGRGASAYSTPFADGPVIDRPGWYRGDLHTHSGHSDGACDSAGSERVPCPVYRTLEAAAARGLDFVALTEHNARSHHQSLASLQPAFDGMVLLAGREITTFRGHFNVFGTTGPLDFRQGAADMAGLLEQSARIGGLVSINHPGLPSGEQCMGCGWQGEEGLEHVSAVEVINGGVLAAAGGDPYGEFSGIAYWEQLLQDGRRVSAVAGSDNHDPREWQPGPLTVVHAQALSQPAIIGGLRAGRVFIDVEGSSDRAIDLSARSASGTAGMGSSLTVVSGDDVIVSVVVDNVPDAVVQLVQNGKRGSAAARSTGASWTFRLSGDGRPGWVRAEAWSSDGRLLLLSNPVYLNR